MPNTKEIKGRIAGIRSTQKITNAMYLISSNKMRKAKRELDMTRPFFEALRTEIKRVFRTVEGVESIYYYPADADRANLPGAYAYLIITADKGLAGAYNQNVIREAERLMAEHNDNKLFVVGEYGRHYFTAHNVPIEEHFLYTAQNPTMHRARKISARLTELYRSREITKLFVIYTDFQNGMTMQARSVRLLPFHSAQMAVGSDEKTVDKPFVFYPSVSDVLEYVVPSYVTGFIYSALVYSFCSEQNARMSAMDAANRNAQELLDSLSIQYNHVRQSAITREITEICAGARVQREKMNMEAQK